MLSIRPLLIDTLLFSSVSFIHLIQFHFILFSSPLVLFYSVPFLLSRPFVLYHCSLFSVCCLLHSSHFLFSYVLLSTVLYHYPFFSIDFSFHLSFSRILFYSILFYSILFYSVPLYPTSVYSPPSFIYPIPYYFLLITSLPSSSFILFHAIFFSLLLFRPLHLSSSFC